MFVSRSGEIEQGLTPPPCSGSGPFGSLTESPSPSSLPPEAADSCDGDSDDGPEYLAIGNLGQRNRLGSQGSTHSGEPAETKQQYLPRSSTAPTPPRRSSFSEGQRGPGRGARGHTRSFSDTGLNQKLRDGKSAGIVSGL